jgi:hypothetical protein
MGGRRVIIGGCVLRREDEVDDSVGEVGVEGDLNVPTSRKDWVWGAPGTRRLVQGLHVVAGKAGELGCGDCPGSIHGGRPFEQRVQLPGPGDGYAAIARSQG